MHLYALSFTTTKFHPSVANVNKFNHYICKEEKKTKLPAQIVMLYYLTIIKITHILRRQGRESIPKKVNIHIPKAECYMRLYL